MDCTKTGKKFVRHLMIRCGKKVEELEWEKKIPPTEFELIKGHAESTTHDDDVVSHLRWFEVKDLDRFRRRRFSQVVGQVRVVLAQQLGQFDDVHVVVVVEVTPPRPLQRV